MIKGQKMNLKHLGGWFIYYDVFRTQLFYCPINKPYALIAAIPGNTFPSKYSSMAPPPVLT
jgi:hypothetical protein